MNSQSLVAISEAIPPRNCTFEPSDWRILARHWYPVALVRDVEAKGVVAAMLLDTRLVVYKSKNNIVVADELCPHRGVPLSLGENEAGDGVRCPYHGLKFGADGKCIHIPASPDGSIPSRLHLKSYPVQIRYGLVWTCLQPDAETVLPFMQHWGDAGFQQINCPSFDIGGFAGRQIEGFLDVAHFSFVHTETFADPENQTVPTYKVSSSQTGFEAEYYSTVSNYPRGVEKQVPKDFLWLRHYRVDLPFVAQLTIHFPNEGRLSIFNAASPVSARKTRLFVPIARNFDTDKPVQDVYDFNARVFQEDAVMVEAQMPENLPLDLKMEAHIPADRSSIAYRRGLKDMGLGHFFTA